MNTMVIQEDAAIVMAVKSLETSQLECHTGADVILSFY